MEGKVRKSRVCLRQTLPDFSVPSSETQTGNFPKKKNPVKTQAEYLLAEKLQYVLFFFHQLTVWHGISRKHPRQVHGLSLRGA